jgi:ribosomal-protein-alanine N-acetyltransferase
MKRPPFSSFPEIESKNLLLRELQENDINNIIDLSVYDHIVATNYEEAKNIFRIVSNDYYSGDTIHWGIVLKSENRIIGTCGYYRGFEDETGEIGYILKAEYQGKGLMSEAINSIINFGFQTMELKILFAITEKVNEKSIALLKRLKFEDSGIPDQNFVQFRLFSPQFNLS